MPATQEVEVVWLTRFLSEGKWAPTEVASIRRAIEERKAVILAGLAVPKAQYWTRRLQAEVEPLLRMRLCPKVGFVVDRWVDTVAVEGEGDAGYWHQVPGTCSFEGPKPGFIERMTGQYDLWKLSSPKLDKDAIAGRIRHPLLVQKDRTSDKTKQTHEQTATDKVAAAIDSMSDKRVKEFIAVERAMQTGETIVMHGATRKSYDRMKKASEKAPAPPEDMGPDCMNPGQNPFVRKNKTGGKHIKEG